MPRNNDNTTSNLLGFLYYQSCQKRVGIDVSRQLNTSVPQQINFTDKVEAN